LPLDDAPLLDEALLDAEPEPEANPLVEELAVA
jgi:hypothetical protein